MEKKFELTPEMKAKIDEIKKAHGVRELSKDELEGVGGAHPSIRETVNIISTPMRLER